MADRTVLGEVVEADHLVPALEQLLDDVAADEPGRARDEHLHAGLSSLSATILDPSSSALRRRPNAKRYQRR